ncbi:hypothetical protein SVIOM74S_02637 [Streptomyces violarus]
MHRNRKAAPAVRTARLACCALLVTATALVGCERGSSDGAEETATGPSGCPDVQARAQTAVTRAERTDIPWGGPTTGPEAVSGRTIVYVAQTMTNPGVAGAARGVREAARVIGWDVRVIDGGGTPAGIQAAMSEAVALRPSGIVIGGFDPDSTAQQAARANAQRIPLIGWHAVPNPAPAGSPTSSPTSPPASRTWPASARSGSSPTRRAVPGSCSSPTRRSPSRGTSPT